MGDMASNSDSVSECHTNSLSNRSVSQPDSELTENELKGWLMKRTRLSRKWRKQWFNLRNCDLHYGPTPEQEKRHMVRMHALAGCLTSLMEVKAQSFKKKIPLTNADISETNVDKKQYAFSIRSKESGRTYYIQADNESTQHQWMQAICFAKAAGMQGSASQACVVQ